MKFRSGLGTSSAISTLTSAKRSVVAEVALLRRTVRGRHVFDYSTMPGSAALGDLVRVPFRGGHAPGIVVRLKALSDVMVELKPLGSVWLAGFVTPAQLELTHRLSTHYGVSRGAALMLTCPVLPLRRMSTSIDGSAVPARVKKKPSIVCYSEAIQRDTVVRSLVERVVRRKQQVLVLVPSVSEVRYWQARFSDELVSYHSDLSKPEIRKIRDEVQRGSARIVVGTRAALYLPFRELGGVVVDFAESENYKQSDQNPRYNGLEVAAWLSELWAASLAYVSPAPLLDTWDSTRRGNGTWRRLNGAVGKVEVADVRPELKPRSRDLIGATLGRHISLALARGGRVFLYLNRRGNATAVLCRDCGWRPACPTCGRSYAWSADTNMLACYHCGTSDRLPLPCPGCGGANLTSMGAGLAELEREVRQTWPGVPLLRIEGTSAAPQHLPEQARLILGTRAALGVLTLGEFSLIGMVAPDAELSVPEYRASEEVWAMARLFQVSGCPLLTVQTRRPEHYVWQSLQSNDVERFYVAELKVRTTMNYPPLVNLVRLTAQSTDDKVALEQAREVRARLQNIIQLPVELRGPYPDYYRRVRGRYRFHLLLRYPRGGYNPDQLWPLLPDGILIDRHPWSVLG